jgi:hypothetical protein
MKRGYDQKHNYIYTHNNHFFGSYIHHHPNYHTLAFHKVHNGELARHNHGNMGLHQTLDSIHYNMSLGRPVAGMEPAVEERVSELVSGPVEVL